MKHSLKLEAIRFLKPPLRMVLPRGK